MGTINKNKLNKKIDDIYLTRLRQMTGEERMKRAFELCGFAWKIAEQNILNEFPNISNEELKEKLRQRLSK